MIYVTKTFLPPQDEYQAILKGAWDSGWITTRGVLVLELEAKLKHVLDYCMVAGVSAVLKKQLNKPIHE